jgi:hypothetical protein
LAPVSSSFVAVTLEKYRAQVRRLRWQFAMLRPSRRIVRRRRYGIYGFSGMRRSRSELYHIKYAEEIYGAEVKQRITAIIPKEYTRMGSSIRHLTRKLQSAPSKVRLLMVISDGKQLYFYQQCRSIVEKDH